MEIIFDFVKQNMELIVLYSGIFNIIALIILLVQNSKISKLDKKYKNLTQGMEDKNLEEIIYKYYERIDNADIKMNRLSKQLDTVEAKLLQTFCKMGIVKYNALQDVGGDISFSIALLDEKYNGVIITSLYVRGGNTVYAKPIKNGKSSLTLSAEELQALDRAKSNTLDEYAKMIS
ncbi:MAG: DUF4446 family protein [Bacillota bacterium]